MVLCAPSNFRIGLIQMACGMDPNENLAKAEWRIREAAGRGRADRLLSRNCSARSISAAKNTPPCSTWPNRSPAPPRESFTALAARTEHRDRRLGVRAPHRRGLSQHGGRHRRRRRAARPLPQDAHPRRPAVFREILLHPRRPGLPLLRHPLRAHRARWSAGTSGIPKRRAWPRWAARRCCSTPPPSAGIPRRRRNTARRSTTPGAPSSAPTPSPTGSTWRR